MYLVDTDVLWVGSPEGPAPPASFAGWMDAQSDPAAWQPRPPPEVPASFADWMDAQSDEVFLSVVTVAEISQGIARLEQLGPASRAAGLRDWLDLVLHLYGERVLPFDVSAACCTGRLTQAAQEASPAYGVAELVIPAVSGSRRVPVKVPSRHPPLGIADITIAAIAESRGLTILTRNPRRFMALEVPAINPFETLPQV